MREGYQRRRNGEIQKIQEYTETKEGRKEDTGRKGREEIQKDGGREGIEKGR